MGTDKDGEKLNGEHVKRKFAPNPKGREKGYVDDRVLAVAQRNYDAAKERLEYCKAKMAEKHGVEVARVLSEVKAEELPLEVLKQIEALLKQHVPK